MNELQVIVNQTPGVIQWNFEDLKVALHDMLENYRVAVYTDESIPAAKADVAMLRKLRAAVEDKRKEIKNRCMEPYTLVEKQAKELTGIIDEPIALINKQVQDYEAAQKARRKEEILKYMAAKFSGLPEAIDKKAQFKIYDPRWENATAKKKDWMAAIDTCREDIDRSLGIINGIEEEFRADAMKEYSINLELSAAIAKAQELQQQRARFLEAERRRQEEAEHRRKEAEEAEARRRAAEEAARAAAQQMKQAPQPQTPTIGQVSESTERSAFAAATAPRQPETLPWDEQPAPVSFAAQTAPQAATTPNDGSVLIRVWGTPEEVQNLLEYAAFAGVRCEKL